MISRKLFLATTVLGLFGLLTACRPAERIQWQTSKVTGVPESPPPFVAKHVFRKVKLIEPTCIVHVPELDRFFVGTRKGLLESFRDQPDAKSELACDFNKELNRDSWPKEADQVQCIYSIAFHPKFTENRYCYVSYTLRSNRGQRNIADGARISRFRVADTNPPRLEKASEDIIMTWEQGNHNGCDLHFGRDGYLYISIGDIRDRTPPDPLHTGQDVTDLPSSILRIDVDQRDPGKKYAVPQDNPFVGLKVEGKPAQPEVWAYGFRNPFKMSFDRESGDLWLGDVGWDLWEMVHKVEKGGNYGWSIVEGRQLVNADFTPGPTPIRTPMIELPHTISASVTGGYVYRGTKFSELVGAYIFGDFATRRMWAARFESERLESLTEITPPDISVVAFAQHSDGELYFLDFNRGEIYTLERNSDQRSNESFPKLLSETGLFASVKDHVPANGVIPYEVNSERWHDGAIAERWLALPNESSISLYPDGGKPLPRRWAFRGFPLHFPTDAVLLKTLTMEMEVGNPDSRRRIETQLLHYNGADWRAYTFAWLDDQSDAKLVAAEGDERHLVIQDTDHPKGSVDLVWRFNDRTQCMVCHNEPAKFTLGFEVAQLNRDVTDATGARINQLVHLSRTGHLVRRTREDKLDRPFNAKLASAQARVVEPFDPANGTLETRARAYLHANCSHCHRNGGGGLVDLDLVFGKPLAETGLLAQPIRGDFQLTDARIIAPGIPHQSTLYYRMSKYGRDRMPHIGAELPHEAALQLISDWITSLAPEQSPSKPFPEPAQYETALQDPAVALRLARAMGRGELSNQQRDELLQALASLDGTPLADLFEGYRPSNGKERKLGARPQASSITALTGDIERGKQLFWAATSKCATCHKVGDQGVNIGPELTQIAAKRSRDELLDSVINPSRTIDPKYSTYQVFTNDGRSVFGLLVRRSTSEIVLQDAQNKEVTVNSENLDRVTTARVSLMPDGLLTNFTAQEAADLLAYLLSLK